MRGQLDAYQPKEQWHEHTLDLANDPVDATQGRRRSLARRYIDDAGFTLRVMDSLSRGPCTRIVCGRSAIGRSGDRLRCW